MKKTALVVLDLINGITQNEYFKPYLDECRTIEHANQLIHHAREKKLLIIFVKVGFSDLYLELADRSPLFAPNKEHGYLKLSESSTAFDAALDYHQEDMVVVKHRINAFYATSLEAILNASRIEHLILCGVSTNLAVEGTARDAHDRNYSVTIASDACAAHSRQDQEASLSVLNMMASVKTVEELCRS